MPDETTSELDHNWSPDRFAPLRASAPELLKEILALEECWRSILEAPLPEKPAGWRNNQSLTPSTPSATSANLARIALEQACERATRDQLTVWKSATFAGRYRVALLLVEPLYGEHFRLKGEQQRGL